MSDELTVTEITETDPMRRKINHECAVAYINADLLNRSHLDVRTSQIFYDEDKLFCNLMLSTNVNEEVLPTLAAKTNIRYWSQGIV